MTFRASLTLVAVVALTPNVARAQREQPARLATFDPQSAAQLKWRYIGPVGNRVASVAGVPGEPNVYYAGAASGGIRSEERRVGKECGGVWWAGRLKHNE